MEPKDLIFGKGLTMRDRTAKDIKRRYDFLEGLHIGKHVGWNHSS